MTKNIVLLCDGTANQFGVSNTNVVRVVQSLVRDDQEQFVYYDPGVGTLPGPGLVTRVGKFLSKVVDLAFATGLDRNVEEAYTYLMNNWEPDDRVYLFGFSRGSYTARVLAALLHHVGLLPRGSENLIPYALRLLRIARKDNLNLGDQFRETFARPTGRADRRFSVHFVGLWDTVSSIGWFWEPEKFRYTATNPGIAIVRHAIAVDERRAFYRQNRFYPPDGTSQDLQQLWFPGVHSDVGGGYTDSDLGRCSFDWILDEAVAAGMHVDPARRNVVAPPIAKPWLEKKHNSLGPVWWLLEFFPKIHFNSQKRHKEIRLNLFRSRKLLDGELLHESTLRRLKEDDDYKPAAISRAFRRYVRGLTTIPPAMTYMKSPTVSAPTTPSAVLPST
ncbi:MAG TPA: DUF2235 domain-containing protein [Thermoanaerobaculia bacterium]|nr:DUF2235 domain-containing protein [Thermoanaerobaculia bacterium]